MQKIQIGTEVFRWNVSSISGNHAGVNRENGVVLFVSNATCLIETEDMIYSCPTDHIMSERACHLDDDVVEWVVEISSNRKELNNEEE